MFYPLHLLTFKLTGFAFHVEEVYLQELHVAQLRNTNMYMLNVLIHFLKQAFFSLPVTNFLKQVSFSAQQVADDHCLNSIAKYYFRKQLTIEQKTHHKALSRDIRKEKTLGFLLNTARVSAKRYCNKTQNRRQSSTGSHHSLKTAF